jgi:hypothetical protein
MALSLEPSVKTSDLLLGPFIHLKINPKAEQSKSYVIFHGLHLLL